MCPDFEQLCPTRRPLTPSYRRLIVWIAAAEFGTEPSVVCGSRLNCWPFALHCFPFHGTGRDGVLFLLFKECVRTHARAAPRPLRTSEPGLPALCSSGAGRLSPLLSPSRRRRDPALAEVCARRWALAEDAARDLGRGLIVSSAAARAPLGWALTSPRPHRRHVHGPHPPLSHPPPPPLPHPPPLPLPHPP